MYMHACACFCAHVGMSSSVCLCECACNTIFIMCMYVCPSTGTRAHYLHTCLPASLSLFFLIRDCDSQIFLDLLGFLIEDT